MNIYEDYNRAKKVNRQLAITLISSHVSVRDFIKLGAVILHTCILLRLPLYFGLKPITHRIVVQICDKCKTPSVYFIYSFSVTWTLTRRKTRKVLKVCRWIFMSLSPPPRPLGVVGKLGRMNWQRKRVEHNGKGKETEAPAFPSSHRPPRAFFFSSITECIFIGISIESLCRVESSGRFVPGKIKHFESLGCFVRCFGFGVGFW